MGVGVLRVNVRRMAEGSGVRRVVMLRLGGLCMCCTVEGVGGLGAEYVWPDIRQYGSAILWKASFLVLIYV